MPTDHSQTVYYEIEQVADYSWRWRVYRYEPTGNRQVVLMRSSAVYDDHGEAADAVCDWCLAMGYDDAKLG